ncbi:MAG: hypothetical protein AB7H66_15025 [Hyphomonadaceae bacterium]
MEVGKARAFAGCTKQALIDGGAELSAQRLAKDGADPAEHAWQARADGAADG